MFSAGRSVKVLFLLIALAIVLGGGWLLTQKNSPLYQPITSFELVSSINQVSEKEINEAVKPYLGGSFWDVPLNKIQAELTRLDWVHSSQVKRKWPDLLYISINEQIPVARWGEAGLVNRSGQVFFPKSMDGFTDLVMLDGTLADSEKVLRNLIALQNQFSNLDMVIRSLSLSADQIWHIQFLDGPGIVLDSLNYEHKLQRFIKAYPKLDMEMRKSARIYDLRYSNGFIIAKK